MAGGCVGRPYLTLVSAPGLAAADAEAAGLALDAGAVDAAPEAAGLALALAGAAALAGLAAALDGRGGRWGCRRRGAAAGGGKQDGSGRECQKRGAQHVVSPSLCRANRRVRFPSRGQSAAPACAP